MPLWSTPKTNWIAGDGFAYGDANRIEQNISDLRDAVYRRVQGFGYLCDIGQAYIEMLPGCCFSEDFYPLKFSGGIKAFTAHSLGFGVGVGGMAPSVTIAANTWYYVFALGHATSSAVEIMIDSSPIGANVTLSNYPYKRFVNSFKTDASSNMVEMYSTGNDVFINPNSMYSSRSKQITGLTTNVYSTVTIESSVGNFLLPAREVLARLNGRADAYVELLGIYSRVAGATTGLTFTIPTNLLSGGNYQAEFLYQKPFNAGDYASYDCDIIVNSSRQISLAVIFSSGFGTNWLAVRGYRDERLI